MGASEKKEEVITAVYKLNLHCDGCARVVEKSITRTSGVHKVDIDVESGRVTVKGTFDPKKMHELVERKSRRKVEWVSPKPKVEKVPEKKEEKKEKKEEIIKTMVVKVHMHCERCEHDLNSKILKLNGVHSVKTNREAGTCTVVGSIDEKKLIEYLRTKVRKHGEVVPAKQEKKEKEEEKKKVSVELKEAKEEVRVEVVEKREEIKREDVVVPYFIHCTHAPQWFSDEDPNACSVM